MKKTGLYILFVLIAVIIIPLRGAKGEVVESSLSGQKKGGFENDTAVLKIVAFGNSITAVRSNVQQVFAQRLPALLKNRGINAVVINSGMGGSHSGRLMDNDRIQVKHGLDRFIPDVLNHKPNLVIIGFGHNDAYIDSNRLDGKSRIPLEDYRSNLIYMITELQKTKSKIILVTPSPIARLQRPSFQNIRLSKYAEVVRSLAVEYQVGLADNNKLFLEYNKNGKRYESLLTDGVHPDDDGHQMIAENLVIEIVKIIENKY
ncbi:SGNH/GDSL hydrolase family protein [Sphingobacterium arenae]|uniref:G-D-S-L family lipolytic protein n=1 Tax=Sphingobacterium arenae TaxID=1280598 RepID=A0ABR7Y9D3_9SPHI|nr:GDSL-type esterase/lipase family protein [Sphingobacterium arenae]MBD1427887.1 G-D-S-L family lipolytic protein [Sphingobacterium arenae]